MIRHHPHGAVLLLLSLLPAGAVAQSDVAQEARGWIGIQVEGHLLADGSSRVMIVGVERDSPAGRAGLRPDDILLRLDGVDVSPEALREMVGRIRPGAPVEMTVLRDNQERRMRVTAGRPPWPPGDVASMEQVAARVDSVRARILLMVDSLLSDTVPPMAGREFEAARRAMLEEAKAMREVLGRTHQEMRRAHFRRMREFAEARSARGFGDRPGPPGRMGARPPERAGAGPPGRIEGRRFRSPQLVGERFVAGAEVQVVEWNLGQDPGAIGTRLQIVRVVEGSPAARAGLAPSDVIVSIGGEPVNNLRAFRIRLGRSRTGGRPEIQVVRGDSTLVVVLPR